MSQRRNPRDNFPFPTWNEVVGAWGDYWYNWMYNSGDWSEMKYDEYNLYKNIPLLSSGISMAEGRKENEEYLNRYEMDWSDVHHPQKLPGSGSYARGIGGSLNFVSSNVRRLYR